MISTAGIYVGTVLAFLIADRIAPIPFTPFVWIYKALTKETFIHPWHPVMVFIIAVSSFVLAGVTRLIWADWGLHTFWPLLLILIFPHLLFGAMPLANKITQGHDYSVVIGLILFWISLPFQP